MDDVREKDAELMVESASVTQLSSYFCFVNMFECFVLSSITCFNCSFSQDSV